MLRAVSYPLAGTPHDLCTQFLAFSSSQSVAIVLLLACHFCAVFPNPRSHSNSGLGKDWLVSISLNSSAWQCLVGPLTGLQWILPSLC